jgi:hypothetical protein
MTRYQLVAIMADGTETSHGPFQNVYVADGYAKALLDLNPNVERVEFRCLA